jgi:membrane protease YdiL (CAAX protease family)
MAILVPLGAILLLTVVANLVDLRGDETARRRFSWCIALLNLPLLAIGITLLFLPPSALEGIGLEGFQTLDPNAAGWVLVAMAVWGILVSLASFRVFLARMMPIDLLSAVHITALLLAGYLVGNTALTLTQDVLQDLSASELSVSILDVVLQQLGFVVVAFVGAGLFTRRDWRQTMQRLGLERPTLSQLGMGLLIIALLVLMQGLAGAIWALLSPDQAQELGSINDALLSGFDTPGEWFVLAAASGLGEEVLFRGALQPVFGLPLTALLFAIVHVQYGLTPITAVVFFLGLILGLVRRRTNTTVAVFVHFGYNLTLGFLSLLAVYLQRFVP